MDTVPLPPPEAPVSGTIIAAPASLPELPAVSDINQDNAGPPPPPKRQRRPSVRLGEIGDQPAATLSYDSHLRRTKHQHQQNFPPWRNQKDPSSSKSSVKARSITNLVNGNRTDHQEVQEERNVQNDSNGGDGLDFGYRKAKARRGTSTTKRVRSNWVSASSIKPDEGSNSREDGEEGFRNFDPDYDSPVHSLEEPPSNWNEQHRLNLEPGRARVSNSDLDYNAREFDSRANNEGVMSWLIELGLSRYAPVFEIHEVDDEVLPMLTLEDLKDMGITAVGSRRKLFSAIQKLRRGLS